jgi:NAD(P)-dependent dehydrogenase (short-subunit alcohol dehydrogenase family)
MAFEKFDLTGKTALITGAAGLLGMEHAAALLESGAKVVMTDIGETILNTARNQLGQNFEANKIITQHMDVSQLDEIREVADTLSSTGVRIDILVNNAAITLRLKGNKEVSKPPDWRTFH